MGIDALEGAVFLDRDGVLNETVIRDGISRPPQSVDEFKFLPGVEKACGKLRDGGFKLFVVTNQPDVARGAQTEENVKVINDLVAAQLPIQEVFTCMHDDADRCDCRKPKPGLILSAAKKWKIELSKSFMVGDRWRDVEAGRAAGCFSILIERSYSGRDLCRPDAVARDLPGAAQIILSSPK